MKISKLNIEKYLKQIIGHVPDLDLMSMDQIGGLSLHMRKGFQLYQLSLLEKKLILVHSQAEEPLSPTQAKKVLQVFSSKLQQQMVLVMEQLPTYLKGRYIAQQIPFMVPGHQLFIPQMFIDLNNFKSSQGEDRSYFRPATQCMILYHLLIEPISGLSQDSIAEKLGYSAMTISRAVHECREKNLITYNSGVHFTYESVELWNKCKPYSESPIKKVLFSDEIVDSYSQYQSGMTALTYYTDLASSDDRTIAISQEQYKKLEKQKFQFDNQNGKIRIEIWEYNPAILSQDKFVDPLSLYLSIYNDNNDARTSLALESLIHQVYD
ncbi:MarR family transcriptional regulator [Saprospiraceae bacterium]|nr:MarR family transcriptional regulator [Saprospiraceae bacterium]